MSESEIQMSDAASDTASPSVLFEEQKTLDLVQELLQSFKNGHMGSDTMFACGGAVPISVTNNVAQQTRMAVDGDPTPTCPPVVLRWDPSSDTVPAGNCKLQFPLDQAEQKTLRNMQQLLDDMEPATFGHQGLDILDESYRKASKLDPSRFACTFSPHELGIVDEVARILLPGVKSKTDTYIACNPASAEPVRVMTAELYKLNVYMGPSGHFKAHVDTPRSTEQVGSLVVCLPCAHQGGQLEVRHEGQSMTFDWSMPEASPRPEIQWAAFYSDCEHEVKEVESGHRITLTYNLYVKKADPTGVAGRSGIMDPTRFPQYKVLSALLLQENFMPEGGYLGVHTSHGYPHTSTSACVPTTLKGSDMAAWEMFRSVGCTVRVQPVLELPWTVHYGHDRSEPCPAVEWVECTGSSDGGDDGDPDELTGLDIPSSHISDGSETTDGSEYLVDHENRAHDLQEDTDQDMAEAALESESEDKDFNIDVDEVQALLQEQESYWSLPKTEFRGLEPAGLLLPKTNQDLDEKVTTAAFEKINAPPVRCQVLGNGLLYHNHHGYPIEYCDKLE